MDAPVKELTSFGEWQSFEPGLTRVKNCLVKLGNPHLRWPHYLVGGTNGKGTVSYNLAKALGPRTGLFLSPHVNDVRERITLAGSWLPDKAWRAARDQILQACPQVKLSYFEWLLVLAVLMFTAEEVPAAVFEVGMGGRLDATNVLAPDLSLVTNVSLDHQQFLGDTVAQIALEKIEIARNQRPFLLPQGLTSDPLIAQRLAEIGPLIHPVCLADDGFENNARFVNQALNLLGKPGLAHLAMLPGRREYLPVGAGVYLDGAHNPAGWRDLVKQLQAKKIPALSVLASLSQGRDVAQFLEILRPMASSFHHWSAGFERELPASQWPGEVRSWQTAQLHKLLEQPLLVCGSLYFVGAFKTWLEKAGYGSS